jgi:O-acetyl-ADP-ribose deacetylase (regulator of RNase III)
MTAIELWTGDITTLDVDAIVNAANNHLVGGGGVCGAIFNAAGWRDMEHACRSIGHCRTGMARVTPGFRLPARHVIHAVGPVWVNGQRDEDGYLADTYRSILRQAEQIGARTVAIPAISTGVFGFPAERAARVRDVTIQQWLEKHPDALEKVILVDYPRRASRSLWDAVDDDRATRHARNQRRLSAPPARMLTWSEGGTRTRSPIGRRQLSRFQRA